jgi:hypothetical protein
MMRIAGLLLLAAIVGVAAFVYDVKYEAGALTRRTVELQRQIERERDMIAALRAEWSALNQPARLEQLAERHLRHLRTFNVAQMALPHEVPERPLDLGVFIESLLGGGLPVVNTETGSPTGSARTPIARPAPQPRAAAPPAANAPLSLLPPRRP